jgi:hypothetical protein
MEKGRVGKARGTHVLSPILTHPCPAPSLTRFVCLLFILLSKCLYCFFVLYPLETRFEPGLDQCGLRISEQEELLVTDFLEAHLNEALQFCCYSLLKEDSSNFLELGEGTYFSEDGLDILGFLVEG